MMNKKILIISALEPWSMQNNVGAPSLYETLKGYSKGGYEITYLTFSKKEKVKNISHAHNIDLELSNLRTLRVNQKSAPAILGNRLSAKLNRMYYHPYSLYIGIKEYLEQVEETPEIIYGYEEHAVYAVSMLSEKFKQESKIIHRFQGTILGKNYNKLTHCLRKYQTYRALKLKADLYVMTNDGTFGDEAIKYLNKDVTKNNLLFPRNGFNLEQFKKEHNRDEVITNLGLDPKNIYAFTLSRLTYWKRVDRAIELINEFHLKYPNLHLIIVGEGEYKENLQQLVSEYKLQDKIHFLGGLGREEVAQYMATLDIFLSLYDVSNLGNPLFEAMISSQCVVTLNNGTTAEVIKNNENGIIVNPEDFNQLKIEFEELIINSQKRLRLKASAKQWANNNLYSWENRMKNEIKWINK